MARIDLELQRFSKERVPLECPRKCVKAEAVDEDGHRVVPSEETNLAERRAQTRWPMN